jgi:acylphosphatase
MFSEIRCTVAGRVQGVGYRDFVERYAHEAGLFGWVKNREDGSVEAVIQGTPDALKLCIEQLNRGSLLAKVESLSIDWRTPEKLYDEFQVISS